MWTVIPDIHADLSRLEATLDAVGDDAPLAFLGDFIDAGRKVQQPDDAAVLQRVRHLVEEEGAVAVMGNHELNAILFHRLGVDGLPLRNHTEKNRTQHRSFCESLGIGTRAALDWTEWFLTLPLWQELDGLRLVHAYWSESDVSMVAQRRPDGRLSVSDLHEVAENSTPFARAVNSLVTGPELKLPDGCGFHDNGGHRREHVRIAWWHADARTWRGSALSVPDLSELPDAGIGSNEGVSFYSEHAPPVLVGHYKMKGLPAVATEKAACLDFPDIPCAYRWHGERVLEQEHLVVLSNEQFRH